VQVFLHWPGVDVILDYPCPNLMDELANATLSIFGGRIADTIFENKTNVSVLQMREAKAILLQ
jgi:hypothetical protein